MTLTATSQSTFSSRVYGTLYYPDGSVKQHIYPSKNLFTDVGMDGLVSQPNRTITRLLGMEFNGGLEVGDGSGTPDFSDVNLFNKVDEDFGSVDTETGKEVNENYIWVTGEFEFGEGEAVGNLTEFGLRADDGYLMTHGLFTDENGDPTTITKLSDEILFITYEVRRFWNNNITQAVVNFETVDYTFDTIIFAQNSTSGGRLTGENGLTSPVFEAQSSAPALFLLNTLSGDYFSDLQAAYDATSSNVGNDDDTIRIVNGDLTSTTFTTEKDEINNIWYIVVTHVVPPNTGNTSNNEIDAFYWCAGSATPAGVSLYTTVSPSINKTPNDELSLTLRVGFSNRV